MGNRVEEVIQVPAVEQEPTGTSDETKPDGEEVLVNGPVARDEVRSEISKDFDSQEDEEGPVYDESSGDVGAWRTLEQRRKLIIYRKLTGHWPDEVSRETGLQSYYEIRYFSTREEHKRKYGKQHALARQWWTEYKEQARTKTGEVGRTQPHLHLVSNE